MELKFNGINNIELESKFGYQQGRNSDEPLFHSVPTE